MSHKKCCYDPCCDPCCNNNYPGMGMYPGFGFGGYWIWIVVIFLFFIFWSNRC